MLLISSILSCTTCTDKVPSGVIILIDSIGLVILLFFLVGKVIVKVKQVRSVNNASV